MKREQAIMDNIRTTQQEKQKNMVLDGKVAAIKQQHPEMIQYIRILCNHIVMNNNLVYKNSFPLPFIQSDIEAYEVIFQEIINEIKQSENDWNVSIQKINAKQMTEKIYRPIYPTYTLNIEVVKKEKIKKHTR